MAALEAANASPAHDQSPPGGRRHRRQVDLAEVNGGLRYPWGLCSRWGGNPHI